MNGYGGGVVVVVVVVVVGGGLWYTRIERRSRYVTLPW